MHEGLLKRVKMLKMQWKNWRQEKNINKKKNSHTHSKKAIPICMQVHSKPNDQHQGAQRQNCHLKDQQLGTGGSSFYFLCFMFICVGTSM